MRLFHATSGRQLIGLVMVSLCVSSAVAGTPRQRTAAAPRRTPAKATRAQMPSAEPIPQSGYWEDEYYDGLPMSGGSACGPACGIGCESGCAAGCAPVGVGLLDGCGPAWVDLDFLLYARRGRWLPPLVTTAPNGGVLPGGTVIFGDNREGAEMRPGGRLRLGTWLDHCNVLSVEGSFLALGDGRVAFDVDSNTTPTIARPFFNLTDDLQNGVIGPDALQVAVPGESTGRLSVNSASDVAAWDVIFRGLLQEMNHSRLDLLVGYQGARINEDLVISSTTFEGGSQIDVMDSFATDNTFHGAAIGFEWVHTCQRLNVELLGKVGFGNMKQVVNIAGQQQVTVDGPPTVTTGGLLAQPTNIGWFQRDEFAVNPEVGINFNYQLTPCVNLSTGYSFMYWNKVAQPGEQIDPMLAVNPDQPPMAGDFQRPEFVFTDSSYYIHGLHGGVQFVW